MIKYYCDRCKRELIPVERKTLRIDWHAWIYRSNDDSPSAGTGKFSFCDECWDDIYDFMKGRYIGEDIKRCCATCKYSDPIDGDLFCTGQKGMPFTGPNECCENWRPRPRYV